MGTPRPTPSDSQSSDADFRLLLEPEPHSNRSSASFLKGSRPNSLEVAIREAFRNMNSESDISAKFLHDVDIFGQEASDEMSMYGYVIDESYEHSELPGDSEDRL